MTPGYIGSLLEYAILTVFYMAAPMLLGGLVVGFVISIFQAVTQINEVTLVFIPKMLAVGLAIWLSGPWIFERLTLFLAEVMVAVSTVSANGQF